MNDSQLDETIEKLISAKRTVCKSNFADSVIDAIKDSEQADSPYFDNMLAAMPIRLGRSFDERVLQACRKLGEKTRRRILPMLAYFSAAACAMFAVFGISGINVSKNTSPLSVRDDYIKLTKMTDEITDISLLLVQEELFDVIQHGYIR